MAEEEPSLREPAVVTTRRGGYRILRLNRPHRLNAFNESMHLALRVALMEAEADKDCRALVITGSGRGFCTGQDLTTRLAKEPGEARVLGGALEAYYNPLVRRIRAMPFPVVAAVNGVAAGAGVNIALACDIVIAARSATFVQAFALIGLIPDSGGTWFLPRLVGSARARGLAMLAEPLTADDAEKWGMIWKTVDDDRLEIETATVCQRLLRMPAKGLALIKRALDTSAGNSLDTQLDLERDLQREASMNPDYQEGVRAFLEKRKPKFSDRR
jgi:2-(1,2-epoxy-1,2-dihydrophenyl)acetyl-CoA isomerase